MTSPSRWDRAWAALLLHEVGPYKNGGLVDDPDDVGGVTKWGVSVRWAKRALGFTAQDIRALTESVAKTVYLLHWWRKSGTNPIDYANISSDDIAIKLFDTAINMGARRAIRLVQAAATDAGNPTKTDGIWGPKTEWAINSSLPGTLLKRFCRRQEAYYKAIVASRPSQNKFIRGWTKRARWLP